MMFGDVLVLILGLGLGSRFAPMLGRLVHQPEEPVGKEAEGADTGDIVGAKAADDGVEGLGAHHIYPDIEGRDVAEDHRQEGREHVLGGFGDSTHVG